MNHRILYGVFVLAASIASYFSLTSSNPREAFSGTELNRLLHPSETLTVHGFDGTLTLTRFWEDYEVSPSSLMTEVLVDTHLVTDEWVGVPLPLGVHGTLIQASFSDLPESFVIQPMKEQSVEVFLTSTRVMEIGIEQTIGGRRIALTLLAWAIAAFFSVINWAAFLHRKK